jgi:hypothetical protein
MAKLLPSSPYKTASILLGLSSIILLFIVIWLLYRANNVNTLIDQSETIIISEEEIY